jgi:beta-phosphoglucomutase family hydrolase
MKEMQNQIEVYPNAKALIFDIDGTLADSMQLHVDALNAVMKPFGVVVSTEFLQSVAGAPVFKLMEILKEKYNLEDMDIEKASIQKEEIFRSLIPQIEPVKPVIDLFHKYYGKLPIACGTGGERLNAIPTLTALGILDKVDAVVTCDDVENGKPAPDTFLKCAEILGVSPSECQVFEDADLGIQAALAGGMMVTDVRLFK